MKYTPRKAAPDKKKIYTYVPLQHTTHRFRSHREQIPQHQKEPTAHFLNSPERDTFIINMLLL
jgi:hypothetical protein